MDLIRGEADVREFAFILLAWAAVQSLKKVLGPSRVPGATDPGTSSFSAPSGVPGPSGSPASAGLPARSGSPSSSDLPASAGLPATSGEPAAIGNLLLEDLFSDSPVAADLIFSLIWDSPTARECFLNQSFNGFVVILDDPRIRHAIEWHDYGGIKYYNKERFESVVPLLGFLTLVEDSARHEIPGKERKEIIGGVQTFLIRLLELSSESEFKFDELRNNLSGVHDMEAKPGNGELNG
jgi:hypothetical protein